MLCHACAMSWPNVHDRMALARRALAKAGGERQLVGCPAGPSAGPALA